MVEKLNEGSFLYISLFYLFGYIAFYLLTIFSGFPAM
mgnify:CR=1 FL=1